MQAFVFEGSGQLSLQDRPMPVLARPDDVLIAVEACGICGTDVQILNVPPGHPATPGTILGHEFVGRVQAAGSSVDASLVGRRVIVDPDPKCGSCTSCRAGRPATCSNIVALGIFRDGALASHVIAPESACHPISDGVPADIAALVEPLACVMNGTNRAAVRPGESAVVFGAGAIGCLFTAVLSASGASPVIVVEPRTERGAVALALGASVVVTPDDLSARRAELLPDGADVVVDAVGSVLAQAIDIAAQSGRLVIFGMNSNARPPIHQTVITEKGLTIMGSYITNFTFPPAIKLVESGVVDLRPLISASLPLARTAEGIAMLRSGQATKVIITP
jgi:threonine dehydrogenase-like Zn-dependent dehydrogenase